MLLNKKQWTIFLFLIFSILIFDFGFAQDIEIDQSKTIFLLDNSIGSAPQDRAGHKNGNIDAGERITFQVALRAIYGDFLSTSVNITCVDNKIKILTPKLSFNTIQEGKTRIANTKLVVEVSKGISHNETIQLHFQINDSQKRKSDNSYINYADYYSFKVNNVGPVKYKRAIIDDDNIGQSKGDGDGIIEKSDRDIEVHLKLKNYGKPSIENSKVRLSSSIKNIRILNGNKKIRFIKGNGNETPVDYVFYIDERGPNSIDLVPMRVNITGSYNGHLYHWVDEFKIGNAFGNLSLDVKNTGVKVLANNKIFNTTKKRYFANTDVSLNFSKNGYDNLFGEVPIKPYKTTFVEVNLVKNPFQDISYIDYKEEKSLLSITTPEDFVNKRSYQDFYIPPKNFKKESKRRYGWIAFASVLSVGLLVDILGYIEKNNYDDGGYPHEGSTAEDYTVGLGSLIMGVWGVGAGFLFRPKGYKRIESSTG